MPDTLECEIPKTYGQIACPRCGVEVPSGSRFCNMCGTALLQEATSRIATHPPTGRVPSHEKTGSLAALPATSTAEKPAEQAPTPEDLAERCLKLILAHEDVPAFSYHISEVISLVGNDAASLQKLTNRILRDYSLTLAVLRRANSAFYNRSNKPIISVARAVTLIGLDAVRSMAGSLILFEHYHKRSACLKELMLLSLLTANHSRCAAAHLALPRAEEAYLCGMFRNLGEVLVACHQGDKYTQILRRMHEKRLAASEACLEVLGFTYEDLGRAMARHWNLPDNVSAVMTSSESVPVRKPGGDNRLGILVAFSHELTDFVYRRGVEDRREVVSYLLKKYGSALALNYQQIQELLATGITETRETFSAVGISLNDLQLHSHTRAALLGESTGEAASPPGDASAKGAEEKPEATLQKFCSHEELLDHQAVELQAAVEPSSGLDLNGIVMMVLEAYHRGAGFDRVVFCLATPDRSEIRGRVGLGRDINEVARKIQIPLAGRREPLAGALLAKKDLFCNTQHDSRYQDSPLVQSLKASCFGLYPVVVDGLTVGCLYFDRLTPDSIPTPKALDTLAHLRNLLAGVIARSAPPCK